MDISRAYRNRFSITSAASESDRHNNLSSFVCRCEDGARCNACFCVAATKIPRCKEGGLSSFEGEL